MRAKPPVQPRVDDLLRQELLNDALSDEEVVERWVENPYLQHVCGERCFPHELDRGGQAQRHDQSRESCNDRGRHDGAWKA